MEEVAPFDFHKGAGWSRYMWGGFYDSILQGRAISRGGAQLVASPPLEFLRTTLEKLDLDVSALQGAPSLKYLLLPPLSPVVIAIVSLQIQHYHRKTLCYHHCAVYSCCCCHPNHQTLNGLSYP